MSRRIPLLQIFVAGVLCFAAGMTFGHLLQPRDVLPPVLLAAVAPLAVSVGLRFRSAPHLLWCLLIELAAFALSTTIVFPATAIAPMIPSARTLEAVRAALVDGWAQALSTTLPAPARPEIVFLPFALTFLTAMVTGEMLFRTRRVFVAALPATALAMVGLAFSSRASGGWPEWTALYLCFAALFIASRAAAFTADPLPFDRRVDYDLVGENKSLERAMRRHRLLVGLPFVVIVVATGFFVARVLPFVDPGRQLSLHDRYEVDAQTRRDASPLAEVAGADGDDGVAFEVRFDTTPPSDARMRLTVLDRYDGAAWTSTGEAVTAGAQLGEPPAAGEVVTVRQTVRSLTSDLPWLPAMPRPIDIDIPARFGAQVDAQTGTLVLPPGNGVPATYSVTSATVKFDPAALSSAGVTTGQDARAAVETSDRLPEDLAKLRGEVVGTASSPFQQLARLLAFFKNDPRVNAGKAFTVDPEAATGFTMAGLSQFLKADGPRAGRPEEFAAAFALLARSQGFPVRLGIGFKLPATAPPGQFVPIKKADMTAWPEVDLAGFGWVPFEPFPSDQDITKLEVQEQKLDAAVSAAVDESSGSEPRPAENPNQNPPRAEEPDDESARQLATLVLVTLVGALALALLLSPLIRKRVRRRRRRAASTTSAQVVGAWHESLDRLVEADLTNPTVLTPLEVSEEARVRVGDDAAAQLASMGALVNEALHAPGEPPTATADAAWSLNEQFEATVRAGNKTGGRVRASFDRRPLSTTPAPDGKHEQLADR